MPRHRHSEVNGGNRSNASTVSHGNHTFLHPPWAISDNNDNNNDNNDNNNDADRGRSSHDYHVADSRGGRGRGRTSSAEGGDDGVVVGGRGGGRGGRGRGRLDRSAESESRTGDGSRPRSETIPARRYGRRSNCHPFDRDLPFWLRLYPFTAPSGGTDSGRHRERVRREDNVVEDRRIINETRARREVSPTVPQKKNVLTVKSCDLHLDVNTSSHGTDQYECTDRDSNQQLVLRRGQPFKLSFTFQRPWNSQADDMTVEFNIGENPSQADGTSIQLPIREFPTVGGGRTEADDTLTHGWAAELCGQTRNQVSVSVVIPPTAIVGEWECVVTTSLTSTGETFVYQGVDDIYVLFNPWCRDDQVYYNGNPQDLNEYVLNEYGCMFQGDSNYISCKPWFYGQFRDGILDTCMTILRLAFELNVSTEMNDVISVVRKLSKVLNDGDSRDPGIMSGNWSGDYSAGTSPSSWRGSVQILKQFARTKQAVRYAQCYIFSHVFTTVCRALGIPCRSLTNYESAHDTDKTITIDSYEDEDERNLLDMKKDSIWNYHCWNDVWINRPDLDLTSSARGRYSGWHAVDSTPQEQSNGRYQCGPCPLAAIKNGEVSVGFDTKFIYCEVNGEVCTWMVPRDGSRDFKLMERKPNAVGKHISTKIPDGKPARGTFNPGAREVDKRRMSITDQYKFPEDSQEERDSLKMAVGDGFGGRIFQNSAGVGIEFSSISNVRVGDNFDFKVVLSNQDSKVKQIHLTIGVFPIDYTGQRLGWNKIAQKVFEDVALSPNAREVFSLKVPEKMYVDQCDGSMSMTLRAFAKVKGEEKPLSKLEKISLSCPEVTVKTIDAPRRLKRSQPFTVAVMVTNPCSKPMTSCALHLGGTIIPTESQGFEEADGTYYKKIKDVFPHEVRHMTVEVTAQKQPLSNGIRELDVDVISKELPDMSGSLDIELQN